MRIQSVVLAGLVTTIVAAAGLFLASGGFGWTSSRNSTSVKTSNNCCPSLRSITRVLSPTKAFYVNVEPPPQGRLSAKVYFHELGPFQGLLLCERCVFILQTASWISHGLLNWLVSIGARLKAKEEFHRGVLSWTYHVLHKTTALTTNVHFPRCVIHNFYVRGAIIASASHIRAPAMLLL